jgi:alpha-ketoglutarate-dependent taurine dioxygenase
MRLPTLLSGHCSPDHPILGEALHEHGAVLVRGSELASAEDFRRWLAASRAELLEYDYGSTPRSQVTGRIYTSTEYPPHQTIPQHNEMSYTNRWPGRLWFFCAKPAAEGGRTPLCHAGEVLRKLDPGLRARFESQGVMYVRNYNLGVDLTWQQAFGTSDRRAVERSAAERGLSISWGPGDQLTTRQIAQAVTHHPVTGEAVWFNQAHLFHISAVEPSVREGLLAAFGEADLPRNAYYGNGRPIEDSILDEVRGVYRELTTGFDWEAGDVLVVDNVLVTHGRTPFRGERSVLVAMSELQGKR